MTPDLFWIPGPWRGKLAVSARPRGGDWLEDEVAGWRAAGLDAVVSLLEPDEAVQLGLEEERELAQTHTIQLLEFPIPDRDVPTSTQDALKLLNYVAGELSNGKNIAVHCRQGVGRSGMVAAGLLMISGMRAVDALGVVSDARGMAVPETTGQRKWLDLLATEYLVAS